MSEATSLKLKLDSVISKNGVPTGGREGQILVKSSNNNYETEWIDNVSANAVEMLPGMPVYYVGISSFNIVLDSSTRCPVIKLGTNNNGENTTYQSITSSLYYQPSDNTMNSFACGTFYVYGEGSSSFGEEVKSSTIYNGGTTAYSNISFYIYNQSESSGIKIPLYDAEGNKLTKLSQLADFKTMKLEMLGTYLGNLKAVATNFPL